MKPHRRQIRLQCAAITGAPHISHGGSVARGTGPRRAPSCGRERTMGRGGNATPSCLDSIGSSDQKKSDSQPIRRPVTLPKVPVATARDVPSASPARLRDP